jgi:hypothetical protein
MAYATRQDTQVGLRWTPSAHEQFNRATWPATRDLFALDGRFRTVGGVPPQYQKQ